VLFDSKALSNFYATPAGQCGLQPCPDAFPYENHPQLGTTLALLPPKHARYSRQEFCRFRREFSRVDATKAAAARSKLRTCFAHFRGFVPQSSSTVFKFTVNPRPRDPWSRSVGGQVEPLMARFSRTAAYDVNPLFPRVFLPICWSRKLRAEDLELIRQRTQRVHVRSEFGEYY